MEGILTKIKNSFFSFKRLKKTAIFGAVFFCLFLGLTLPFYSAYAFVQLIGLWVAACVISMVTQVALVLSTLILLIFGLILSWVLSPYFINIPYTHLTDAAGNITIVGVGWPIVRDFANMFFIIILAVIGLATALRLSDYQAKKALPKLVIIALLINFTPVMMGLIIDASNIVMNFFLEELTGFQLIKNQFSAQGSLILQTLTGCINPLNAISAFAKTIVMIIFNLTAALIFAMYSLLFIMRYVMIWMLVILSPFAFFTMLLAPSTRKTLSLGLLDWDEWWKNFIQWCIIGVTGAFFLYLGEQIMVIFTKESITLSPIAAGGGGWLTMDFVEFFGEILQYLVVLAFLIVGFFSATSTSAMGAGFITGAFKKYGTMGAKMAGAWATRRGLAAARGAVPQGLRTRLEGMAAAKAPAWGAGRKGVAGYALRTAAGATGFLRGRAAGAAISAVVGGDRTTASKATDEAKKRNYIENLNALRDPTTSKADRMGIIRGMMEAKQMRDALSEDVAGDKVLTSEEAFEAYQEARQLKDRDATEDMEWSFAHMKGMPEKMAKLVDQETASNKDEKDRTGALYGRLSGLSEDDVKLYGYTSYKDKIIRSAKSTDDFKKFHKGLWKDKGAIESALQFDAHQIGAATTQFGRAFSDNLQTAAEEKVAERGDLSWFYEVNPLTGKMRAPKLPKYLASNPAQGVYMPLTGAENIESAKRLEEEGRIGQEIRPFADNELDAEFARTRERESELNQQLKTPQPKEVAKGLRKELEGITRRRKVVEREYDRRTKPTPAVVPPAPPEEEPLAAKINRFREQEEVAKTALSRMKTLGRPKDIIEKAEVDLQRIKEQRAGWEGRLATYLRRDELKVNLEKARGREQKTRQGLATARDKMNQIKGEVSELTRKREETDRQLYSFEEEMGKVSSDIEGRTTRLSELKTEQGGLQKETEAREARVKELQQEKEDLRKSGLPREQRRPEITRINQQIDAERASLSGLRTVLGKNERGTEQIQNELGNLKQRKVELGGETKERGDQLRRLGADIQKRNRVLGNNQKQQNDLEKSLESTLKNINTIESESERVEGIIESGATTREDEGYVRDLREGMGEYISRAVRERTGPAMEAGKIVIKKVAEKVKKAGEIEEKAEAKVEKVVESALPKRMQRKRKMEKIIKEEREKKT